VVAGAYDGPERSIGEDIFPAWRRLSGAADGELRGMPFENARLLCRIVAASLLR
jgi:hypothetical protein